MKLRNYLQSLLFQRHLLAAACFGIVAGLGISIVPFVDFGAAKLPGTGIDGLELPKIDETKLSTTDATQAVVVQLFQNALDFAKIVFEAIAVGFIVFTGAMIVTNLSNEEAIKKHQNTLMFALVGFVLLNIGEVAIAIFNPVNTAGELAEPPSEWLNFVDIVLNIIKYFVGTLAVGMLIITGYKMVSGQEKDLAKEKRSILWIAVGLMFVLIAHLIQRAFIYNDTTGFTGVTGTQTERANELILDIAGLILTVMAPVALFFVVLSAVYFLTANGDEARIKKARNIFVGTVIAIVMAFTSYTLVREVVVTAAKYTT